jgi:spore coat protein A, manganese oxidase
VKITRKEFLKFAGAAAVALPLGSLAISSCDKRLSLSGNTGRTSQVAVTPFQIPLPVPPILQPTRIDNTTDYYEITQKEGQVKILPGLRTTVWGYNGIFPGPTIVARRGRQVMVRHRNELPVPVVVHLHGGKTPPESDGYPTDLILPAHATNKAVAMHKGHSTVSGIGHGFKDYTYPNEQQSATLWYHDHRDMFTGPQVYKGLAGFYIVHDAVEDELPLPKGDKDIPLMIADHVFNEDGSFFYPSLDPTLNEQGLADGYHDGVQGDTILVNGAPFPFLEVSNTRYRFRFLNASNRRIYRLALEPPPSEGAAFIQIGSDGGLLSAPFPQKELLISPAERFDVVIDFSHYAVGTQVVLKNLDGEDRTSQVMRFDVVRSQRDDSAIPDRLTSDEEPLDPAQAEVTRRVVFRRFGKRFRINGKEFDPNHIEFRPRLNSTEIWEVFADTSHPFHLHLAHFRVLSRNNQKTFPSDVGWKDTVHVGARQMVRVIARFAPYRGKYIYHCHIMEHEDLGMMDNFEVI